MNRIVVSSEVVSDISAERRDSSTGRLSAFFLNVEKALAKGPDSEIFEMRVRRQLYSVIRDNGIGDLFEWREPRLSALVKKELESGVFEGAASSIGPEGHLTELNFSQNGIVDPLFEALRERIKGIPENIFKEFCANYRTVRIDPSDHVAYITMRELLYPGLIILGYFDWLRCRDKWAESLVLEAKTKWDNSTSDIL